MSKTGGEICVGGRRVRAAAAAQLIVYVLLFASAAALAAAGRPVVAGVWTAAVSAVLIAILLWRWPLPALAADRGVNIVTCVICGVCSVAAGLPSAGGQLWLLERWGVVFGLVAVMLVVAGFGRQLLRVERTHFLRSLSGELVGGVCSLMVGGWGFLPALMARAAWELAHGRDVQTAAALMWIVVAITGLGIASLSWVRENETTDPRILGGRRLRQNPWLGLSVLPVMISGSAVYMAALALNLTG